MKQLWKACAVVAALYAGSVSADQFGDAVAAYKAADYSTAYGLFHRLAQREHAQAQLNIATLTARGDGIIQSDKDALYWAWRARLAGAAEAIPTIQYLTSRTTPDDQSAVAQQLRFAYMDQFEKGDVRAAFKLGRTLNEVYAPRDIQAAYVWFAIAAALDVPYAKALRETMSVELDTVTRAKSQDEATLRLTRWCLRQDEKPMVCNNLITSAEG